MAPASASPRWAGRSSASSPPPSTPICSMAGNATHAPSDQHSHRGDLGMAVFRMITLASALWLAATPAKALDLAGTVAALRGSAFATGPNGFERRLQVGSTILVGDRT